MAILKLTQGAVERLPFTNRGTKWFHDPELRGFALAVGMTTKTFYASCEAAGRTLRRKIAKADVMTAPEARRRAAEMLVGMRQGVDPRRPASASLAEAFETYLQRRRLKATTAKQYREAFELYLKDWLRRPIAGLTRQEVDAKHRQIGRRAPYAANQVMRVLRAVLNDARKRGIIGDNPTDAVSWYQEQRRQSRLGARLGEWWEAVERLDNPVRRTYLRTVLLTGLRRNEVARLRWDDLDLGDAPTVHIRDPKRGPALTLPLARQAADLLREYRSAAERIGAGSPWIFPAQSRSGHIEEPHEPSVPGSIHDLRREWISVATEVGVPLVLAKAAVGHSIGAGDVTLGYAVALDVRPTVQRVADELMRRAQPQREDLDAINEVSTGLAALTV